MGAGCGSSRNHVSYVVVADKKTYWPIVSKLKPLVRGKTESEILGELVIAAEKLIRGEKQGY